MLGIDLVAAVGEKAAMIAEGTLASGGSTVRFTTKEDALQTLERELEAGTAMLVKASHAMQFEWIVEKLREKYD